MDRVFMNENDIPEIRRSRWVDNFFRPVLIVVMIMCLNLSLVNFVRLFNPAWNGLYFLLAMLLTTVEAIYSYRVLKHWRSRGISLLRYRLAELMVLLLLLKLIHFAGMSLPEIQAELWRLWFDPLSFIGFEFYMMLTLALVAWVAATATIADFEALYDPYTFRTDSIIPLDDLRSRFLWGGVALVLISGITHGAARSGFSGLTDWQRPSLSGIIFNVLVYFTLGLVLLSQANLTRLMVRWRVQKIEVEPTLVKQWGKYALAFLTLVTGVVFILPTGYTLGFLASAALVITYILDWITFILQFLVFLFILPFAWLFSLLEETPIEPEIVPPSPPPEFGGLGGPTPLPWLEALRSLIFWLVILAGAGYLLRAYFADHPELLPSLRRFRLFNFVFELIRQLWHTLRGTARAGLRLIPRRTPAKEGDLSAGSGLSRAWFGRLSPRERILYYYRNILRRAESRRWYQTPYEYEPDLEQTVPQAQTEVHNVTEAFVHARYSRATWNEMQADSVKQQWQRIKQELRRRRKGRPAD